MMISIIIRTFNEEKYLYELLSAIGNQSISNSIEVIIVDSESTDNTLNIAKLFSFVKVFSIKKNDFTYGYALNYGISKSSGDIYVCISGHCIPQNKNWLRELTRPILSGKYKISYGRQIGSSDSRSSEIVIFKNYFVNSDNPKYSYPNNANCAYLAKIFLKNKFDENLIALEDINFSLNFKNNEIFYSKRATVFHIHEENNAQVFMRFFRESYVFHKYFSQCNIKIYDLHIFSLFQFISDIASDAKYVLKNRNFFKSFKGIIGFRISQYYGLYIGKNIYNINTKNRIHKVLISIITRRKITFNKLRRLLS